MYIVNLKLPRLITVSDYHEFQDLEDKLRILKKDLRVAEVGFDNGEYVGVVYTGRKPGKLELRELADEQDIELA